MTVPEHHVGVFGDTLSASDARFQNSLATHVSISDGAVFLKLFVPPLYDGAYLAFDGAGEPRGVISQEAARLLERATCAPITTLIRDASGALNPTALDLVTELLQAGLLTPCTTSGAAYWIRPDTSDRTQHIGPGATRFIRYFYDYFGSVFHDGSLLIDSHGGFLEVIAGYFPQTPGRLCIDLGCGSGYYTAALARLGHRVFATDISRTRLDAAVTKPTGAGEIVPMLADVEDVPLPDGTIDFAMCNFVLEHVADPFSVIDEMIRLLRSDGEMLLAVPSFNIRDTLAYWMYREAPSLNFEHLRSYGLIPGTHPWCAVTSDTISYLTRCGMDLVQMRGENILQGLWQPWLQEFERISGELGPNFATTWPWNALGRQTIIFARKR